MNRRRFLQALGLTPVAPKAMLAAAPAPLKLSGLAAWLPVELPGRDDMFFGIDRTVEPVSYLPATQFGRIEWLRNAVALGLISKATAAELL